MQMKQLKIKDNQYKQKEEFFEVMSVVERVAEDISNNQMILQSYNHMYCSGNVMGFLGFGDERLVIESRFSLGEKDYFFQYLLEKVMDFPNFINLETNVNREDNIFNLLLFLFLHYIKKAARKGAFKTYIKN